MTTETSPNGQQSAPRLLGSRSPPGCATEAALRRNWSAHATYTLAVLTFISALNYLDRAILGLALPLIKREMGASDALLGLVSGLAFALFYSLVGMPIASLADRWNRRNIIAVGLGLWSLMTALTGLVTSIGQLAAARFLMGAGEACGIAPSNSMLSDLFAEQRRPLALAIFGTATTIAFVAFFPLVGWIGQHAGWRAMFVACGLPGLALALLLWITVKEPARGAADNVVHTLDTHTFRATLSFLAASRCYRLILLGAMFMGASVYAGSTWDSSFLMRVHHLQLVQIARSLGPIQGVAWGAGAILGGLLTNWFGRHDERWRLWVPALACLLAAPSQALFLLGGEPVAWMGGLALTNFFMLVHQGPIFAIAMSLAKIRMRAVAIAALVLVSGLLGQIIGPIIVGALNDQLRSIYGDAAIRYSLLIVVGYTICACACFLTAARYFTADRSRAVATGASAYDAPPRGFPEAMPQA